jgi:hypothetical protein
MKYIIPIFILIFTLILFKRNDELLDGNPIHIRGIGNYKHTSLIKLKKILNEFYDIPVIIDKPLDVYYEYGRIDGQKTIEKYDSGENTILITNDKLYSSYSGKRVGGLAEYLGNIIIIVDDNYPNLKRVVIHEIGHTKGLEHCDDSHCYMSINRNDDEILYLCKKCQKMSKIISFFNI